MTQNQNIQRRAWLKAALCGAAFGVTSDVWAQQPQQGRLTNPVFKVAKRGEPNVKAKPANPLDPALDMARAALARSQREIRDYTCVLVKRERVNGKVGAQEQMIAEVMNSKERDGRLVSPLRVHLKFVAPKAVKDREVLYVQGENNGKMLAKEGGLSGRFLPSVWLNPTGVLAMRGQLHPITDIGIENLIRQLIERGEKEKRNPNGCEVKFKPGYKINKRICTLLELKHPVKRPGDEFYLAQIYIDDQMGIPIRYAAYDWPTGPKRQMEVIEEYTYLNVKVNVGLTAKHFKSDNPKFNF